MISLLVINGNEEKSGWLVRERGVLYLVGWDRLIFFRFWNQVFFFFLFLFLLFIYLFIHLYNILLL